MDERTTEVLFLHVYYVCTKIRFFVTVHKFAVCERNEMLFGTEKAALIKQKQINYYSKTTPTGTCNLQRLAFN